MYEYGTGVATDTAEAVKLYRKAADQGHAGAQRILNNMYDFCTTTGALGIMDQG